MTISNENIDRAEVFLELYSKLENHLRKVTSKGRDPSFSKLIEIAKDNDPFIRKNLFKIKDYGDLRNAIVHHQKDSDDIVIADPRDTAIEEFKKIVNSVLKPRTLETFRKQINSFQITDKLQDALIYMGKNDFSQIVIQNESKFSLLTVEGITKWLEHNIEEGIILSDVKIEDAFSCESKNNFSILGRQQTIYDAQEIFSTTIERQVPRIYAIIITENGKSSEHPLGIITPWDLLTVSEG